MKHVKKQAVKRRNHRLWRTVCHEAGHAVADFVFGFRVGRVSVVPDNVSLGRVHTRKKTLKQREFIEYGVGVFSDRTTTRKIARWHDEVVSLLAGREAVRLLAPGSKFRIGTEGDLHQAHDILMRLHPENELPLVLKWLEMRARNLVSRPEHRATIRALAGAFMKKPEMTGAEVLTVLGDARQKYFSRNCKAFKSLLASAANTSVPDTKATKSVTL